MLGPLWGSGDDRLNWPPGPGCRTPVHSPHAAGLSCFQPKSDRVSRCLEAFQRRPAPWSGRRSSAARSAQDHRARRCLSAPPPALPALVRLPSPPRPAARPLPLLGGPPAPSAGQASPAPPRSPPASLGGSAAKSRALLGLPPRRGCPAAAPRSAELSLLNLAQPGSRCCSNSL